VIVRNATAACTSADTGPVVGMNTAKENSTLQHKPRTWRVWILRKRTHVEAPDRAAAEAAAVIRFNLTGDLRKRLMIRECRD
jgi:hypothetical protein